MKNGKRGPKSVLPPRHVLTRLRWDRRMTLQEIGDRYGVTRERVRQVLRGLPRRPLRREIVPLTVEITLHDPWGVGKASCSDCGTVIGPGSRWRGRCAACYQRWLYRTSPERRRQQREAWRRWREINPERWREINNRALRAYRARRKALREAWGKG